MSRHVNSIAGRLSLRAPQRRSLEILDRVTELVPPRKDTDLAAALAAIRAEYPTVTEFEREFVSLCFALATGVGKTRLMGAFIAYLHLAHGLNNFFVLAPSLTIYNKLIADFTPNTPKYVFPGISEFTVSPPVLTTGDNYERQIATGGQLFPVTINIFNISKINSEVRGGRSPRIRSFREEIGESYFDYLAGQKDLVLIMDESHRYRATAGVKAINELKPVMGLELTATPFTEQGQNTVWFRNVIYHYPLATAMEDGFVKEPAVVTRRDFDPAGMSPEALQQLKLEDGIRLHESVKVDLETWARQTGEKIVKPFLLVVARDTTHARQLMELIASNEFFGGRYAGRVIQIDSSQSGAEKDDNVERLLKVEDRDEPTEIVIHVNMLKEGWDVTNLYTIVPLRAANARTLVEQSIGRGLRLPYGRRTGVAAVDRLNIVAHDRFQEIVDEANRPGSAIRLTQVELDPADFGRQTVSVTAEPQISRMFGMSADGATPSGDPATPPAFEPGEIRAAQLTLDAIRTLGRRGEIGSRESLVQPETQALIAREVEQKLLTGQLDLAGVVPEVDIPAVVAKATDIVVRKTIDIPRIMVVPKGEVRAGFRPFRLALATMRYAAPSDDLWVQYLRTNEHVILSARTEGFRESRLEDYVVSGLIDCDDVSYDEQSGLLYDLAAQVVEHLRSYLSEEDAGKVLQLHQREITRFVHAQMQDHAWQDDTVEYDVIVRHQPGVPPRASVFTAPDQTVLDFRHPPADRGHIARYVFGGFARCLFDKQKFHSDTERALAVILDRDSERWFRPASGQFQIFYREGHTHREYVPDFVAEGADAIFMLEPKAANEMQTAEVLAKRDAAVEWCRQASDHAATREGKPWRYLLIPHRAIADNMSLTGLAAEYGVTRA